MHSLLKPAKQALIGGNQLAVSGNSNGEVDAIVCGMVEVDGQAGRTFEHGARRQKLKVGVLQKLGGEQSFVLRKLAAPYFLPEDVRALCGEKVGCDKLRSVAK